jgi:hypothetical protein
MSNSFELFQTYNCNKVLPLTYDESLSYFEMIAKLVNYVNDMVTKVNGNTEEETNLRNQYNEVLQQLIEVKEQFQFYVNGDTVPDGSISFKKFDKNVLAILNEYIEQYVYDMHKFVSFGLEDDYFVAYIPSTWEDITFSTSADGNLVLEF